MAVKKSIQLTDRHIPGITWKQVVAFVVLIGSSIWLYFRIETLAKDGLRQSQDNGIVLKEMQVERKELMRINEARLNLIELQLAEQRIRLTNLELNINKTKN